MICSHANCNKLISPKSRLGLCLFHRGKRYYANNSHIFKKSARKYLENNRDKKKQIANNWKAKNPERHRFKNGKGEAKRRNIDWLIDYETFVKLIDNCCTYCNKDLKTEGGVSLDRVDCSGPYSLTNVVPCCGQCNKTRNNFYTVEEMKVMISALKQHRDSSIPRSS